MLPSRWFGLTVQRPLIRSRASDETDEGNLILPSTILVVDVSFDHGYRDRVYLQLVNFHGILIPEWRLSNKEFENQDTKSPPVDSSAMAWS